MLSALYTPLQEGINAIARKGKQMKDEPMTQLYTRHDVLTMATRAVDSLVAKHLGQTEYFQCDVDHREDVFQTARENNTFIAIRIDYRGQRKEIPVYLCPVGDSKPADGALHLAEPHLYEAEKPTDGKWAETESKIGDWVEKRLAGLITEFLDANNPAKEASQ